MSEHLAEKESGSIWNNPQLRGYLGEIARRHGVVDCLALPNMRDLPPIQIEKLFVQPELSLEPISQSADKWPRGESLLECLANNRAVVLLGDPGSGKTTLINWLSWRLSAGLVKELPNFLNSYLPIPCVLREIDPSLFENINEISKLAITVASRLLGSRLSGGVKNAIEECVSSNKYILMLDGVDEISIENRKVVAKWISFAEEHGAYVVATSRVVGYDEYPVHRVAFDSQRGASKSVGLSSISESRDVAVHGFQKEDSYKNADLGFSNFLESEDSQVFQWAVLRYLMPFNDQRIELFIGNWYLQRSGSEVDAKEKSSDLMLALKQSKATHELARTPNLLSLISIVHRERAHLPDGRALLYKEISNAYINTIDSQRKIKIDDELLRHDWTVREGWIAYVGFKMQIERSSDNGKDKLGVLVKKEKVLLWLEEAMTPFFHGSASKHAAVFLDWVARRSGLLLPKGEGKYAFVHLSFQEYFCARYMVSQVVTPKFIRGVFSDCDLVTHDSFELWIQESIWCESFIYFFELISSEASQDWVSFVVEKMFSPNYPELGLYSDSGKLAAKILANIHVSIPEQYRITLARKCSCNDNPEVEADLARAGFAINVKKGLGESGLGSPEGVKSILSQCDSADNIYKIAIRNKKLKNFSEFKSFINLEALNLISCEISSLSFVNKMKNLKQIRLDQTKVKDFSHIFSLPELRFLYLGGSNISDVSEINNLKNLTSVDLDSTNIRDISSLGGCENLFYVSLHGTGVRDISCLRSANGIRYLYLGRLEIDDFSVLNDLKNLNGLNLAHSNFNNLNYICELDNLVELNLSFLPHLDLSPISKCKGLKRLVLNNATAEQLQYLSGMTWLEELTLMRANVSDLEFVSSMASLKRLILDGSNVIDLSPIKKLHGLEMLDIDNTPVADVSALSTLRNLKYLHIRGAKVQSVGALKNIANLTIFGSLLRV